MSLCRFACSCVVLSTIVLFMPLRLVEAANILWDGTGSSWNSVTPWSLISNGPSPNPAAKPGASDTAIFNIETVNTSQTVNLNAAQAALGLFFSSTGAVTIQTGTGTNTLTLGSGGITVNPGAGINTITSAVSMSAPQSWINNSANALNLNGTIATADHDLTVEGSGNTNINGSLGLGHYMLTKNGSGTLSLNGANHNSGQLLINAGNVILGAGNAIDPFLIVTLTFGAGSTGTLSLNGNDTNFDSFSTNAVVGSPIIQNASATPATFRTDPFGIPRTFAGVLRDGPGGGSLGLTLRSLMTLSGNNQYTGLTEVSALLTLEHSNALGSTAGGTKLLAGGEVDLRGLSIGNEELFVQDGSKLHNTSLSPASWAGNITYDGTVDSFEVQGIGDITFSGGTSNLTAGSLTVEKSGPNTLELSGSTDNGGLRLHVTDGMVRLAKASSSGVHAGSVATVDGGTLQLAGTGGDQISSVVQVNSGSFDMNGRSESLRGFEISGSGIGGAGALLHSASGESVLTVGGAPFSYMAIVGFARIGVTQSGANLILSSDFTLSDGVLQKVGLGTLTLNGSNEDHSGDVLLTAGTIAVGSNTALGTGALTFEGGALRAEGAPRTIANPMTASSTGVVTGATDLTLTGVITGSAGLTMNGAGRLTLTAANSYAGLTTVNVGTLAVNGSIPGSVEINSGATLAGTGTIGGAVTLNAGGTVAPGASVESLNIGSLSMSAGSSVAMVIGGTTPISEYDQLLASGTLAFDGTLSVSLFNGFSPSAGASFNLFDGTISGVFDVLSLPNLSGVLGWDTSQLYTTGVLSVAAGEPGDFDNDGDVDGRDFLIWQRNTSVGDLADWQANYGVGVLTANGIVVPEPSAIVLVLLGFYSLSRKRLYR